MTEAKPLIAESSTSEPMQVEAAMNDLRDGLLTIPTYQRDADQWDDGMKSLFIESIINNLTVPAFCRYFKKQTNMTFTDFVNQYRMERAKNLLMQNKNVSEVCYAIGLESLSYFNKVFRQIVGENPSDFKRKWNQH